jgi:hypothetical protein
MAIKYTAVKIPVGEAEKEAYVPNLHKNMRNKNADCQ